MTVKYSERKAGGRMHYVARAPSESALKAWVDGIMSRYHPNGYDTHFNKVWRDGTQDGQPVWLVIGSRRLAA